MTFITSKHDYEKSMAGNHCNVELMIYNHDTEKSVKETMTEIRDLLS
jgi:hypothetical protein